MYVTSGHGAVRGECVCMSLAGTVQYVVSVCIDRRRDLRSPVTSSMLLSVLT